MTKLMDDMEAYWTNRAEGYSQVNQDELHSAQKNKWSHLLMQELSCLQSGSKILDCGTGPGFFAILLAEKEMQVTACDYNQEMLKKAQQNANTTRNKITWIKADAQNLPFHDCSFDAIVTRNLTWSLEKPEKAYQEWHRILRKGGILLNFDANWYRYLYDDHLKKAFEKDREDVKANHMLDFNDGTDVNEMERIARLLPLSTVDRPQWDMKILQECGFLSSEANTAIGNTVLSEVEKLNFRSTPIFMIRAVK